MIIERQRQRVIGLYETGEDSSVTVRASFVGRFVCHVKAGQTVGAGSVIGTFWSLDQQFDVALPDDHDFLQVKKVLQSGANVEYNQDLLILTRGQSVVGDAGTQEESQTTGLFITAPQPGRVYLQPSPGEPSYVKVGDTISTGQLLLLIEIMKTFTPLQYGGEAQKLPATAKIKSVLVTDSAEIEQGQKLFELEAA